MTVFMLAHALLMINDGVWGGWEHKVEYQVFFFFFPTGVCDFFLFWKEKATIQRSIFYVQSKCDDDVPTAENTHSFKKPKTNIPSILSTHGHKHAHSHTYAHAHGPTCTCIHTHKHACACAGPHTHAHTHTGPHTHTHTFYLSYTSKSSSNHQFIKRPIGRSIFQPLVNKTNIHLISKCSTALQSNKLTFGQLKKQSIPLFLLLNKSPPLMNHQNDHHWWTSGLTEQDQGHSPLLYEIVHWLCFLWLCRMCQHQSGHHGQDQPACLSLPSLHLLH